MTVLAGYEYEIPPRKRTCQYCDEIGFWIVSTPDGRPVCTACLRAQVDALQVGGATYRSDLPCLDPVEYPTYSWRCGKCANCRKASNQDRRPDGD